MIGCIIQARMGSSRLPNKTLMDLDGKSTLERLVSRLKSSRCIDEIAVATTTQPNDEAIEIECNRLGILCYRGSEDDVLQRVVDCAKEFQMDYIVEITADCPLMDCSIVDRTIDLYFMKKTICDIDMAVNFIPKTYPKGYEVRVFSREILEKVNERVDNPIDRQHVSTWMFWNPKSKRHYKVFNVTAMPEENRPDLEITLDTPEDLELIRTLFKMGREYNLEMNCEQVISMINMYPFIYQPVEKVVRKDYYTEIMDYYRSHDIKVGRTPNSKLAMSLKYKKKRMEKKRGRK